MAKPLERVRLRFPPRLNPGWSPVCGVSNLQYVRAFFINDLFASQVSASGVCILLGQQQFEALEHRVLTSPEVLVREVPLFATHELRPMSVVFIFTVVLALIVIVDLLGRHRHDCCAYAVILDRALSDNECIHYVLAHKHPGQRCVELTKVVEN